MNNIEKITNRVSKEIANRKEKCLVNRLYFYCDFCGKLTKIQCGVLLESVDGVRITNSYNNKIEIKASLPKLICKKCLVKR